MQRRHPDSQPDTYFMAWWFLCVMPRPDSLSVESSSLAWSLVQYNAGKNSHWQRNPSEGRRSDTGAWYGARVERLGSKRDRKEATEIRPWRPPSCSWYRHHTSTSVSIAISFLSLKKEIIYSVCHFPNPTPPCLAPVSAHHIFTSDHGATQQWHSPAEHQSHDDVQC